MKALKSSVVLVILLACITGCGTNIEEDIAGSDSSATEAATVTEDEALQYNDNFSENRINIAEYQKVYTEETDTVRDGAYDNLRFSDAEFASIDGVETVGIYRLYSGKLGAEESAEIVKNWLESIGCDDIDLERELRDASGQYESGSEEYPYDYPAVFDYYPEFESGHGFFINTNQCYIQMGNDGIYSMSDGSITGLLNYDGLAAMDALGINEENIVDRGLVARKGDDEWELPGGSMSVNEASEVVKDYFEMGTPFQNPDGISVDTPEVEVFTLNDKYGYAFKVRRIYKGVPFAYADGGMRTYYSSDYEIVEDIKTAYIIYDDTVAAYTGYSDAELIEGLIEEQTEMLGLSDAVILLDDFLADQVVVEVSGVNLVYCTCVDGAGNKIAYPCWQFEGVNQTNNQIMRFYVNTLSGEIYYYSYVED